MTNRGGSANRTTKRLYDRKLKRALERSSPKARKLARTLAVAPRGQHAQDTQMEEPDNGQP